MVAAAACDDGPQPTATEAVHPALEKAVATLRNTSSFGFVERWSESIPGISLEFGETGFEATGNYQSPDRFTKRALVSEFPVQPAIPARSINVGEERYLIDPATGEWMLFHDDLGLGQIYRESLFRNPVDLFSAILAEGEPHEYQGIITPPESAVLFCIQARREVMTETFSRTHGARTFDQERLRIECRPTLEVDPATAPVVREIFEKSLRGSGLKEICKELNYRGVTNRGKRWYKGTLHYVLRNEAYTGTAVWGKTSKGEKSQDPVRVEGAWPALVSRELFDGVQQAMRERAPKVRRPARVGSRFLLSGLLKCGVCGRPYSAQGAKIGQFAYYICGTLFREGAGTCSARYLNAPRLEEFVVEKIRERILNEETIVALVTLVAEEIDVIAGEMSGRLEVIEAELSDVLMLPGTDGIELMKDILGAGDVPVIFVSAYGRDELIARAFDMGAVDYVVKPFSPTELAARIRAALRRRAASEPSEPYVLGDLTIDYAERRVTLAGRPLPLIAMEYRLLAELSANAGRLLTYEHLLERVWGEKSSGDVRPMRTIVSKLRRKLGDDADNPNYIFTEPRVGYRMPKGETKEQEEAM